MSKFSRKIPSSDIVIDQGLVAETERVFAAGRQLAGSIEFDEEQAIALARRIQSQLAELSPDLRLVNRNKLISFLHDLNSLIDRLENEKIGVEQRLVKRARQKIADQAYGSGGKK